MWPVHIENMTHSEAKLQERVDQQSTDIENLKDELAQQKQSGNNKNQWYEKPH